MNITKNPFLVVGGIVADYLEVSGPTEGMHEALQTAATVCYGSAPLIHESSDLYTYWIGQVTPFVSTLASRQHPFHKSIHAIATESDISKHPAMWVLLGQAISAEVSILSSPLVTIYGPATMN